MKGMIAHCLRSCWTKNVEKGELFGIPNRAKLLML